MLEDSVAVPEETVELEIARPRWWTTALVALLSSFAGAYIGGWVVLSWQGADLAVVFHETAESVPASVGPAAGMLHASIAMAWNGLVALLGALGGGVLGAVAGGVGWPVVVVAHQRRRQR